MTHCIQYAGGYCTSNKRFPSHCSLHNFVKKAQIRSHVFLSLSSGATDQQGSLFETMANILGLKYVIIFVKLTCIRLNEEQNEDRHNSTEQCEVVLWNWPMNAIMKRIFTLHINHIKSLSDPLFLCMEASAFMSLHSFSPFQPNSYRKDKSRAKTGL